jgi:sugar/nucleoside kinase (ribokinase family)
MMTRPRLLQLSGVIVDLIYLIDAVPAPGEEARVSDFTMAAGGGFNAMVAAQRAGAAVTYGGGIGNGAFAEIARRDLSAADITLARPAYGPLDQGCCTVLIDAGGERTFIAREGAEAQLSDAEFAALPLAGFDALLLSGYGLSYAGSEQTLTNWLRQRAAGEPPLIFDPSPVVASLSAAALEAALSCATWVSANAKEAAFLTGKSDAAEAAQQLSRRISDPLGGVIVRDGAEGCYLAQGGLPAQYCPGHAVDAIDTNGAGDTHIGSFIARICQGDTPLLAAQYANIAAALSTTTEGPATAPKPEDVIKILAGNAAGQII